jgi:hypothetical protein
LFYILLLPKHTLPSPKATASNILLTPKSTKKILIVIHIFLHATKNEIIVFYYICKKQILRK